MMADTTQQIRETIQQLYPGCGYTLADGKLHVYASGGESVRELFSTNDAGVLRLLREGGSTVETTRSNAAGAILSDHLSTRPHP